MKIEARLLEINEHASLSIEKNEDIKDRALKQWIYSI